MATMESIDKDQVFHIAKLCRLHLDEHEAMQFAAELGAILDYASRLPSLEGQSELSSLTSEEDRAEPYSHPEELLQNAVALENGYVKVPAILDKSSEA
jgi:aspartyl/glutamyl-tRNA(Asn/Gln) amidotransferase C subunit